jgi:hypothetical protein
MAAVVMKSEMRLERKTAISTRSFALPLQLRQRRPRVHERAGDSDQLVGFGSLSLSDCRRLNYRPAFYSSAKNVGATLRSVWRNDTIPSFQIPPRKR